MRSITDKDTISCFVLTWVVHTQSQRDSTLVTVVEAVAGDGHCAVDGHLVLLTVLCYVERV